MKNLLSLLMAFATMISISCEPEPINDAPSTVNHISKTYEIPHYLLGYYTRPENKDSLLRITEEEVSLYVGSYYNEDIGNTVNNYEFIFYGFNCESIFINGDCWTEITYNNGLTLRISDYIKELDMVVLSVWENGVRVKEYGVFYKIKEK